MSWVILSTYTLPQEMNIHKSILELEGIECAVKDEMTTQVHNFYSNAIGGVKLMVRTEDYKKAREVLLTQTDYKEPFDDEQLSCVYCGSLNVKGVGIKGKLSILLLHLTGLHISINNSELKCVSCSKTFPVKTLKQKIIYEKGENDL
ncbi:MAG: DUF2007 domain-containing protein [Flavobacteriales bacterium]|nr:DUF2007 domain-containing protein [Flavobacteriales bacterium]